MGLLLSLLLSTSALAWDERGPDGVPTGRELSASDHFAPADVAWKEAVFPTPAADLGAVAAETARVMRAQREAHPELFTAGLFEELGVTVDDVLETLDFVARIAEEDRGKPVQRLQEPDFVARHFEVLRWTSDTAAAADRDIALSPEQIRLTKYLVYEVSGSPVRTGTYDTALYALPSDEASGAHPGFARLRYTRPQVFAGVYEAGGEAHGLAQPLVWLTRDGALKALMQGTVAVDLGDREVLYNVHRNNGIAWDPSQKDGNKQDRYWYFREVDGVLGVEEIPLRAHAAVAGDIYNVGLGKLVALEMPGDDGTAHVRLAVLADTGGAFQPNLFQLDWLAGSYPDHDAFLEGTRHLPTRVGASVLVLQRER